jgi:hypothetical protein
MKEGEEMIVNGLIVQPNSLCIEKTSEPIKIHTKKKKISYHKRIQKKWIKRYGFVWKPCMFIVQDRFLVCHPSYIPEFKRIMENEAQRKVKI